MSKIHQFEYLTKRQKGKHYRELFLYKNIDSLFKKKDKLIIIISKPFYLN